MTQLPLDDVRAPLFTVGQVAQMLDVRPAFLRRLDQLCVVRPARSSGRQRRYSREQIAQVAEVCSLVGEGLTLAGVRRVFALQARVEELEAELAAERGRRGGADGSVRGAPRQPPANSGAPRSGALTWAEGMQSHAASAQ